MESMRWVGVDVHAKESVAAVLDQTTGEVSTHRLAGRPDEVLDWLATVAQPFRAVYEAAQHHLTAWLVTATSGDSGFDEFQPEFAKWRNLSE